MIRTLYTHMPFIAATIIRFVTISERNISKTINSFVSSVPIELVSPIILIRNDHRLVKSTLVFSSLSCYYLVMFICACLFIAKTCSTFLWCCAVDPLLFYYVLSSLFCHIFFRVVGLVWFGVLVFGVVVVVSFARNVW